MTPNETFVVGQRVPKTFHGIGGYTEECVRVVAKVEDGVAYITSHDVAEDGSADLSDHETGITYDAETGMEIERFFMPMHATIVPLVEGPQSHG